MLRKLFTRERAYLFAHMIVVGSTIFSITTTAKESIRREPCTFSQEEKSFMRKVGGINRLLHDRRITCEQFRTLFEKHKKWDDSRRREQRRPPPNSDYGTDSERIQELLKAERHLNGSDLRGLDMGWIDLTGAHLNGANLSGTGTNAKRAPGTRRGYVFGIDLSRARLTGAEISRAIAKETLLRFSLLIGVDFSETDLSHSVLYGADMRWSNLKDSILTGADFSDTDLQGVVFEPKSGMLPNTADIASARNLEKMTFRDSPNQLSQLRTAFYAADLKEQARRITYAIQHTKRIQDAERGFIGQILSLARLFTFEWTVGYGMNASRPILIVLVLIPLFGAVYFMALVKPGARRLWINRQSGAISYNGVDRWFPVDRIIRSNSKWRRWRFLKVAMWFSLMCAFRVGFREIDIGQWLARLQPRQYKIGARGWCRSVAGLQSLISVYLLALTILCVVGRPFG